MEPNWGEILGVMMTTTRNQQVAIDHALKELKGEIVNANVAAVAATGAAIEARQAATVLHGASKQVADAAAKGAHGAVAPAVVKAFEEASDAAAIALDRAAKPTLDKFAGFSRAAGEAEAKIRSAGKWVGWRAFALAAFSVGLVWIISWGGLLWERADYAKLVEQNRALNAEIETAKVNLAALHADGGKIKFRPGGCGGHVCIEASPNQGPAQEKWRPPWFLDGVPGGFVIPKGY